jgi:hypothetical protein
MLTLPPDTRIFMGLAPIDMRRSFDGLCAAVVEVLNQNPLEGHLFLFRGKRGDRVHQGDLPDREADPPDGRRDALLAELDEVCCVLEAACERRTPRVHAVPKR